MSSSVLKDLDRDNLVSFICPACEMAHTIRKGNGTNFPPSWIIDGSLEKPTIRPSIMFTYQTGDEISVQTHQCHSMITEGVIKYFNDCSHKMAGESVEMQRYN